MVRNALEGFRVLAVSAALLVGGGLRLEAQTANRNPPIHAQSEKSDDTPSRIENFAKRHGRVLISEQYFVGTILEDHKYVRLELKAVVFYEPGKRAERLKGVEVEVERGSGQLPGGILLDLETAAEAAAAIAQLKALSSDLSQKESSTSTYTARYSTPNGFRIGIERIYDPSEQASGQPVGFAIGNARHEVVISMPGTMTHMPLSSLDELQGAFESAVKLATSK